MYCYAVKYVRTKNNQRGLQSQDRIPRSITRLAERHETKAKHLRCTSIQRGQKSGAGADFCFYL